MEVGPTQALREAPETGSSIEALGHAGRQVPQVERVAAYLDEHTDATVAGQATVGDAFGAMFLLVIGFALYPVVADSIDQTNATGIVGTLLPLGKIVYVLGIIFGALAFFGLQSRTV